MQSLNVPFLGFDGEAPLHALADALPHGLFTTDANGTVTYWNGAAERITGWSCVEAIGRNCSILTGDAISGCSCGAGPLRCALATSGRSAKQCTIRTKDGRLLAIVKTAVPIRGASGEPIGALEVFAPLTGDHAAVGAEVADEANGFELIGASAAMRDLYRSITLVAASDAPVMIHGESGTGKELIAQAVHRLSSRARARLVRVPCGSLGGDRLEGELFADGANHFEEADGGTLLLDEVGDLTAARQTKLLHTLELRDRRAATSHEASVRLVCTTHHDLRRSVEEGRFRPDLYFRLNVFPLRVPPLRERIDDIELLARRFFSAWNVRCVLAPDSVAALQAHPWPGNVRELQNALRYAALHANGGVIQRHHLPPDFAPVRRPEPKADDRAAIEQALRRANGNRTVAARALGISRVTLWKRLKQHRLE